MKRYIVTFKNEMTQKVVSLVVSLDFDRPISNATVIAGAGNMLREIAGESSIFYTPIKFEVI